MNDVVHYGYKFIDKRNAELLQVKHVMGILENIMTEQENENLTISTFHDHTVKMHCA